jgi:hypothetical protein
MTAQNWSVPMSRHRWGSVGILGPLTVLPEYWDKGAGQMLLAETMKRFDTWGNDLVTLFTFPHSPKHVHLYQKFGFWPQTLIPVMAKRVASSSDPLGVSTFTALPANKRAAVIAACRELSGKIYKGLDLTTEIEGLDKQRIGDTVLLYNDEELSGFAICHLGSGSEAGSDSLYIKFGAVIRV